MREIRTYGSEGGAAQTIAPSLPLSMRVAMAVTLANCGAPALAGPPKAETPFADAYVIRRLHARVGDALPTPT